MFLKNIFLTVAVSSAVFILDNAKAASAQVTETPLVQIELQMDVVFDECTASALNRDGGSLIECVYAVGPFPESGEFKNSSLSDDSYTSTKFFLNQGMLYIQFINHGWVDDTPDPKEHEKFFVRLKDYYYGRSLVLETTYIGPSFDTSSFGTPVPQ